LKRYCNNIKLLGWSDPFYKEFDMKQAVLFPHCVLAEGDLEAVLRTCESLTAGIPWYMEPPRIGDQALMKRLKCVYPPEDLRPEGDFSAVLGEYQTWIGNHPERGYQGFIKAYMARQDEDSPAWLIRQEIKVGSEAAAFPRAATLHRHLILHMSTQVELNGREADTLLDEAKGRGPLLADALEETPPPDPFFNQLSAGGGYGYLTREQTASAIEAWLWLFSKAVAPEAPLLTLNPEVPNLAKDLCEERGLTLTVRQDFLTEGPQRAKVTVLEMQPPAAEAQGHPLLDALSHRLLLYWEG